MDYLEKHILWIDAGLVAPGRGRGRTSVNTDEAKRRMVGEGGED